MNASRKTRTLLAPAITFVVALAASWPLLLHPWLATDDGIFHLYRLASLLRHWHAGHLYPRWFADFAFGYGHPILNYYAPLTYYLALPWSLLGLPPLLATKLTVFLSLWAGALGAYLLVRDLSDDDSAGILAAAAYTFFPYHLADLYTRGALPEGIAFAWIPFALWAWHRAMTAERGSGGYAILGGIAYAALILTHNLSAFIATPFLLLWVLLVTWKQCSWRKLALRVGPAWFLAAGISAFYWLPVLAEIRWVQMGVAGISTGYRQHLISLGTLLKPAFFYPYTPSGVPAVRPLPTLFLLLAIPGIFLAIRRRSRTEIAWFSLTAVVAGAMLWTGSLAVWMLLERWLSLLQYPWRFLLLAGTALAPLIGLGLLWIPRHFRWWAAAGLGLILLVSSARIPLKPIPAPDLSQETMWRTDYDNRQIGATWTAEFVPVTVEVDRTAVPNDPTPGEEKPSPIGCVPRVEPLSWRPLRSRWDVDAPCAFDMSLHQFAFPDWRVTVDGEAVPTRALSGLGLVGWRMPPGRHVVEVRKVSTTARTIGTAVSLISALALAWWAFRRSRRGFVIGTTLLVLAMALAVASLFPFRFSRHPVPVSHDLAGEAMLVGYDLSGEWRPGGRATVRLYWLGLKPMGEDYHVFVHVYRPDTMQVVAQHDGVPVGGFTPTRRWLPGELLWDDHTVSLPKDLPPGRYRIGVGMYRLGPPVQNLPVVGESFPGNRIPLQDVEVRR